MSQTLVIGIDLGNSNCSLSYFMPGTSDSKMVPLEDGKNVLPSVVLFPFNGSEPWVGTPARDGLGNGLRFENFKGKLMSEAEPEAVTDEKKTVTKSPMDALTTLLRYLATRASTHGELNSYFVPRQEQFVPREPIYLTLGVPTQAPEHYKDRLRRACVASGWLTEEQTTEYLSFVAEPIAVPLNIKPGERRNFFIYDHGGLTLDMARIQLDQAQSPPYKVLAYKERVACTIQGRSYNVGGSMLDRLLLRFALTRAGGVSALQSQVLEAYEIEFDAARLETLVQLEIDPPNSGNEARVYANLCRDMERLRIALSPQTALAQRFSLGSGSLPVKTKISVKKEDLDEAFREVFQAIRQKMSSTIGEGELCFLVGGCSLTPAFQGLMKEYFGSIRAQVPDSPMETIARGLSKYYRTGIAGADGVGEFVPVVDDSVDTDYGVWNDGMARWDVVLSKGTSFSDTALPKSIPGSSGGIFQVYRPLTQTTEISLRVGQRDITGEWIKLGERAVHLPSPTTNFRLYFSMNSQTQKLEMRLFSSETKKLIRVTDPQFTINTIKKE